MKRRRNKMVHSEIYDALKEHGAIGPTWRIEIGNRDLNPIDSDWVTVSVDVYKPRCRKPQGCWHLAIYMPKDEIHWNKSQYVNLR